VTAGKCRLTTLRTGRLYTLEILIWLQDRSATGRIMSMTPSGIELTTLKLVAHRLKGKGPDKLRGSQEFEIHDSQRVKVIKLTILRTGCLYVRD
jgi:hypothetical protein